MASWKYRVGLQRQVRTEIKNEIQELMINPMTADEKSSNKNSPSTFLVHNKNMLKCRAQKKTDRARRPLLQLHICSLTTWRCCRKWLSPLEKLVEFQKVLANCSATSACSSCNNMDSESISFSVKSMYVPTYSEQSRGESIPGGGGIIKYAAENKTDRSKYIQCGNFQTCAVICCGELDCSQ